MQYLISYMLFPYKNVHKHGNRLQSIPFYEVLIWLFLFCSYDYVYWIVQPFWQKLFNHARLPLFHFPHSHLPQDKHRGIRRSFNLYVASTNNMSEIDLHFLILKKDASQNIFLCNSYFNNRTCTLKTTMLWNLMIKKHSICLLVPEPCWAHPQLSLSHLHSQFWRMMQCYGDPSTI